MLGELNEFKKGTGMDEHSNTEKLPMDFWFSEGDPIWWLITSQSVDVIRIDGEPFIQWDFVLRDGRNVHFRELRNMLVSPKVLACCKNYITRTLCEKYNP